MASGFYTILLVIHTIIVLFLIMMVLVQRTDSDGLGGLGGGGGNQFMTGRSAANLMTRTTAILAGAFMLTSLILAIIASHNSSHSILETAPATQAPAQNSAVPKAVPANKDTAHSPAKEEPATPAVPKPE
jgi:preprotein translocase subunit SecG